MGSKRKKKLSWALNRMHLLLARNACQHETFYGVLNRADACALRTLAEFAHQALISSGTFYLGDCRCPVKPMLW